MRGQKSIEIQSRVPVGKPAVRLEAELAVEFPAGGRNRRQTVGTVNAALARPGRARCGVPRAGIPTLEIGCE